jgi:hypothetical protein
MDKYENHTDRRIKELHERMSKLGKRKKIAKFLEINNMM